MDFQRFVNSVDMPCCVMSVQKTAEGGCGEIRIIAANAVYKQIMGPGYYDNMLYSELVPQDNKFEDYCFRAAIGKQRMHAYVETKALGTWTDQTIIPLASDREDLGYCQFIFEFTQQAESDRMATVSVNTAGRVIEACIKLMGAEDFKTSVQDVLDLILNASGGRASRVMLVDHDKHTALNFCERLHPEELSTRSEVELSYELVCSWEKVIGVSNAVILKDEQDMAELARANPAWAASMRESEVKSLVLIPLRRGQSVVGYLYVVNFDVTRVVETKELLELISFFLGSEIYNHLLLQKLEELSQVDVLTGVYNRRAMIKRIHMLSSCQPRCSYGLINMDLNGLKFVNDSDGHEAGDRLLIQAGELLRKVFYEEDIFRTGGDEFIVVIGSIDRETFERKNRRLRADAEKNGVYFAIGSFWSDGSTDFTTAFRQADEMMYADKRAFYENHPALKHR